MSLETVDGIIQRNLNSCKSTIYYKLYPDIYKRDSPLFNNYTKAQQAELTPIYLRVWYCLKKIQYSVGDNRQVWRNTIFGSIEEKLVFDVRKKILLNLLS